jgi:hypothetical protein
MFDSVPLVAPVINGIPLEFPYKTFEEFTSYCGAGQGLGDIIVPERIFGLKISPACYIHDVSWEIADASWTEFHQTNSIFLNNILEIIRYKSSSWILEHIRNYRAITYYNAVNTIGTKLFWATKKAQGLLTPDPLYLAGVVNEFF